MRINVLELNKKTDLLKDKMTGGKSFEELERKIAPKLCTEGLYAAFISVCDMQTRAKVFRCAAASLSDAWHGACDKARKYITNEDINAEWVRADIICKSERVSTAKVIDKISAGFNESFRKGISFDEELSTALTEAEINGNRVISYKQKALEVPQINKYLKISCRQQLEALPEELILFDCVSAFCDEENKTYSLYSGGSSCGRRKLGRFGKQTAAEVISTSSEYLSMQLDLTGRFGGCIYPIHHTQTTSYNIVRHALAIRGMLAAYRVTEDRFTLKQAECALGFLVKNSFYKYKKPLSEENTAYIADLSAREVRISGNSAAIIAMTDYMDIVGGDRYKKLCTELGNGILELFDSSTGEFTHVLEIPKLTVKEKQRTVYYDGEAVFALAKLYGLTGEKRFLDAAQCTAERLIREDYTIYRDHWISCAMNEITKYLPEERYFEFGLKNAQLNLKKIYDSKTTYHTYLELLCATFELYERITEEKISVSYLNEFDTALFIKTLFHRAEFMLNGYCYPEYVMYLKYPERIKGAFFIRHDGFRIRIDDIQHFCCAYCAMHRSYEKLEALKKAHKEN